MLLLSDLLLVNSTVAAADGELDDDDSDVERRATF